jgi:hypothetical protein
MAITLVNKTISHSGGSTIAIPATSSGNTLVVVIASGAASFTPHLSGTIALTLAAQDNAGTTAVWYLTNIPAGATSITFITSLSQVIIYELSPCILDVATGDLGTNDELFGYPIANNAILSTNTFPLTSPNGVQGLTVNFTNEFVVAAILATSQSVNCASPSMFSPIGITSVTGGVAIDDTKTPNTGTGNTSSIASTFGGSGFIYPIFTSAGNALFSCGVGTPAAGGTFPAYGFWTGVIAGFYQPGPPPPPPPVITVGNPPGLGGSACTSSLNISPATELFKAFIPAGSMAESEYLTEGRKAIVIDFNNGAGVYARDFETQFSWGVQTHIVLRVWQPTLIPLPENVFDRATDWDDGGTPANKFIQGIVIEADSAGVGKTFSLQSSDDLSMHSLNEMPATFPTQSTKAFSCVTPFIAHSSRIVATDGVSWRVFRSNIVYKPWPEQTMNWQCEQTSFGMKGWLHTRELNIAYASAQSITVNLVPDTGPTVTLTLPSSGGPLVQNKTKVTLPPMKFKLLSMQVVSTAPFYLFEGDLEVKIKAWGSTGPYEVLKIVGGPSQSGAAV